MNPYKVLNIDYRANNREILEAVALAMREKKFPIREVAIAQKELLDPISRVVHNFLNFINVKPLKEKVVLSRLEETTIPQLNRLSVFDGNEDS